MAQESIEELLSRLPHDEPAGGPAELGAAEPELFESAEKGFQWIIAPEQFVDFWIAAIFLLVGTWQIITILFLIVG